jgi:HTH-type transcriptional regulator / antitoxin HigA
MNVKPLRSEEDYRAAVAEVEQLWDSKPGSKEFDTLDVLSLLIETYEREHDRIDPPDPIEAILFRMEQQGLTRKDLEPYIGSRARVSEVLAGHRPLSITMVRKLHEALGISAEVLIREPKLASTKSASRPAFERKERGPEQKTKGRKVKRRSAA